MEVFNFDCEFSAFLIRSITKLFNHRKYDELAELGVNIETAKKISNLPLSDAEKLSFSRGRIGKVLVLDDIIQLKLRHIQHEASRDKLYDKLIQMGASHAMMHELSGMDATEFRERRNHLGLPKASAGRPSALTDNESTQVLNTWQRFKGEEDDLVRLVYVGCETNIPLSRIWQFLKTPDDANGIELNNKKLRLVSNAS